MPQYDYEVAVIGAGPGGYETAIRAAQRGKKTCIIEASRVGGTCLNVGCIPTKALIQSSEALTAVKHAASFGVEGVKAEDISLNWEQVQARKRMVVDTLVNGVKGLLKGNKVTLLEGTASFQDPHTLTVGEQTITAESIIIATGSKVFMPPFIAVEGDARVLTSQEALELDQIPSSITIIGGGVIGIEFAFLFRRLGCQVTVLELMDHILPMVDPEVSKLVQKRLAKEGVIFRLGAKVEKVQDCRVHYQWNGENSYVGAEAVLMAVGRVPNLNELNVDKIGLAMEGRAIKTDQHLRTNIPNIYAVGDVNGKVMLAHTASHEGAVAVDNICGVENEMHYDCIPSCIYLEPEIACIGLTEEQAREQYGDNIKIGRFRMVANGKTLIMGDLDGMFKVILKGDDGTILGVHLYGQHATDLIAEVAAAKTGGLTAKEMLETIHPHPTVSEAIGEAFRAAWLGRAINSL